MRVMMALVALFLFGSLGLANGKVVTAVPSDTGIYVRTSTPSADHIYWVNSRETTLDGKPVSLKNLKTRMDAGDTLYATVAPDLSGVKFHSKPPVETGVPEKPQAPWSPQFPATTCPNCRYR